MLPIYALACRRRSNAARGFTLEEELQPLPHRREELLQRCPQSGVIRRVVRRRCTQRAHRIPIHRRRLGRRMKETHVAIRPGKDGEVVERTLGHRRGLRRPGEYRKDQDDRRRQPAAGREH